MDNGHPDPTPLEGIYRSIASADPLAGVGSGSVYTRLARQLDWRQWRPVLDPTVEVHHVASAREGDFWILHEVECDTYLRISEPEHSVWQQLDGQHSAEQLGAEYAEATGAADPMDIVEFLYVLRAGSFLQEEHRDVYAELQHALDRAKPESRLAALQARLRYWPVAALKDDGALGSVLARVGRYAGRGWVSVGLAALGIAGLLGIVAMFRAGGPAAGDGVSAGAVQLAKIGGSYLLGLILLLAAQVAFDLIGEVGSALALLAYGRRVPWFEAGLSFGLPTFRADRRQACLLAASERLLVELYGVSLEFGAAGAFGLAAWSWPNNFCFNVAMLGMARVFLSGCPWCGSRLYRALSDYLQQPRLRAASASLFRTRLLREVLGIPLFLLGAWLLVRPWGDATGAGLWIRWTLFVAAVACAAAMMWRQAGKGSPVGEEPLSREEWLGAGFLTYSVLWCLALAWATVWVVASGAFRWGIVRDVNAGLSVGSMVALVLVLALPAVLAGAFVLASAVLLASWVASWLRGLAVWRDADRLSRTAYIAAALLAFGHVFLPAPAAQPWLASAQVLGPLACLLACVLLALDAGRSAVRTHATAFGVFAALTLGSEAAAVSTAAWAVAYVGGFAALAFGVAMMWRRERPGPSARLGALLVGVALLAGMAPAYQNFLLLPTWTVEQVSSAIGALVGAVTLAGLAPWVTSRCGSQTVRIGMGAFVGVTALTMASAISMTMPWPYGVPHRFDAAYCQGLLAESLRAFGVLMVAASVWLFWRLGRTARFELSTYPRTSGSDAARLKSAFVFVANEVLASVAKLCGETHARHMARVLAERAQALGWPLEVRGLCVSADALEDQELSAIAGTLSAALTTLLQCVGDWFGHALVERLCTRVHDHIHWEDRELASTYIFGGTSWAAALAQAPSLRRDRLANTLKRTILFNRLAERDLDALVARFQPESYQAGQALIRQGDEGDRFFVVQTGAVEVMADAPDGSRRALAYLHGGDYFGEVALLSNVPRTATVIAVTDVSVYTLARDDFQAVSRSLGDLADNIVQTIMDIRRLRSVPVFAARTEGELFVLLTKLQLEAWEHGQIIFRQGTPGDKFYIIRSGEVIIETIDGQATPREIAALRAGEYFGEIALCSDVPRTATARAKTRTEAWALAKDKFLELVQTHRLNAKTLEQTASRRLLQLRKELTAAAYRRPQKTDDQEDE